MNYAKTSCGFLIYFLRQIYEANIDKGHNVRKGLFVFVNERWHTN